MNKGPVKSNLDSFNKAFAKYLTYNKRDQGALIENRANRIRWAVYRRYRDIAPSKERIESEARSRGYRIRRGKTRSGKRRTVQQEIAARSRASKFLSTSFLYPWKVSRVGQSGSFLSKSRRGQRRNIGSVRLDTAKGRRNPSVRISSFLAGAIKQDRQRGIVAGVLNDERKDMLAYVARKQREEFKNIMRTGRA